ncbi:MAG: carboxypeptidase regulatory-like domain-containing protein [Oscillospiraceae bacterium]|nr:carboxypeptidase regulatory-like domain-containing protein [Oscillospiraceae bacterium]
MTKKFISMFLALVMCLSIGGIASALNVSTTDVTNSAEESWNSFLDEIDNLTFTKADYLNDFRSYADDSSTINLLTTYFIAEGANVVGIVLDCETSKPVVGAEIHVMGDNNVNLVFSTDKQGRFQITNMPNAKYDWMILAPNYVDATYKAYDVDSHDGTTIFTFYISSNRAIVKNRNEIGNQSDAHKLETDALLPQQATPIMEMSMSTPPEVEPLITVYYNNAIKEVKRQEYLYTVLSSELYNANYYESFGLSDNAITQLYAAQAVAANTFVEYVQNVYSNHGNEGYDVCSTECCQAYDSTKVTTQAIGVVGNYVRVLDLTNGLRYRVVLYKPTNKTYDYIWGSYFSSCGSKGTQTHNTEPALIGKACTDLTNGVVQKGYGMCQMGAAQKAKDGYTYNQILNYYSNCEIVPCPIKT